jgi:hypothetical protein
MTKATQKTTTAEGFLRIGDDFLFQRQTFVSLGRFVSSQKDDRGYMKLYGIFDQCFLPRERKV